MTYLKHKLRLCAEQHAHQVRIELHAHGIEVKRMHEPVIIDVIYWQDIDRVNLITRIDEAIATHGLQSPRAG